MKESEEQRAVGTGLAVGLLVVWVIYLAAAWIMANLDHCNRYFPCG